MQKIEPNKQLVLLGEDGVEYVYQFNNGQYEYADHNGISSVKYDEKTKIYCCYHSSSRVTETILSEGNQKIEKTNANGFITSYFYEGDKLREIQTPGGMTYRFTYQDKNIIVSKNQRWTGMYFAYVSIK